MLKKTFLILSLICLLFPAFVGAAGLVPCGTRDNPQMCTTCDLLALGQNILTLVLKYSFVVGAIFIMIAGFNMMFSQGHSGKIALAWKTITNVIIGIIIILSAWLIVNTVLYFFVSPRTTPELRSSWYRLKCGSNAPVITP